MQSLASLMSLKQSDIGNLDDFNDSDDDEEKKFSPGSRLVTSPTGTAHLDARARCDAVTQCPYTPSEYHHMKHIYAQYYRSHTMVNGLHLYSAFIQSAAQFMPLIHPFTHTFTYQWRLAAMQGTKQLARSNWGLGVLLRDTSTRPGWDRTGNPSDCQTTALTSWAIPPHYLPHRGSATLVVESHTSYAGFCFRLRTGAQFRPK